MFQIISADFSNVFLNVRERISDKLVSPHSAIKEHLQDSLLFNQHLVSLVRDSLRDLRGLRVIDTVGWRLPIVLDRSEVGCPDERHT